MITEFNSRLRSELSSRTDDIAANVVNMVERKLRSNANWHGTNDQNMPFTGNITQTSGKSYQHRQGPQYVRVMDANNASLTATFSVTAQTGPSTAFD